MDELTMDGTEAGQAEVFALDPDTSGESVEDEAADQEAATANVVAQGMDADGLRQQISEFFPMVWVGDLAGETFEEVLAALPDALEKSRHIRSEQQPDAVPSGPISRSAVIDLESLSPESKIRAGLRR